MRLPDEDVPKIPAPAALVDSHGTILEGAFTPEWRGPGPSTIAYRMGTGRLLVGSADADPNTDQVITDLLDAIERAARRLPDQKACLARILGAGLAAASGRPITATGTLTEVLEYTKLGVTARAGKDVDLSFAGSWNDHPIEGPHALALALIQLVVNLKEHKQATEVTITASYGPTFTLSCPTDPAGSRSTVVTTSRSSGQRERWGAAYVRHIADALGGSVTSPRYPTPTRCEISLGFGTSRLALPLAVTDGVTITDDTPTWSEETGLSHGSSLTPYLTELVVDARKSPGAIISKYPFEARATGTNVWLAKPPNDGADIAREVVNGLAHERALWYGCEPEKTEVYALSWILSRTLGTSWPSENNLRFHLKFTEVCTALNLPLLDPQLDSMTLPDPSITAYLLSRLGGSLVETGSAVFLEVPAQSREHHLARLLGTDGRIPLITA